MPAARQILRAAAFTYVAAAATRLLDVMRWDPCAAVLMQPVIRTERCERYASKAPSRDLGRPDAFDEVPDSLAPARGPGLGFGDETGD